MSAKAKRVLPTRPEPPTVEQILSDVRGAHPTDPVFLLPAEPQREPGVCPGPAAEQTERLYRQSRSYVEMHRWLEGSRERLREQRQELQRTGEALESSIADMRLRAL
ncbi:UPF0449 protein C19orf25 homolog [Melopsittacus undulatus]|uniref:UPF0449 protein C19orf25 homolog n=1 Tax=Melopsittacus undulatus TaxID=13146 RepID=UPI00146F29C2|nr:UPF0449 protein C19orf25 homolog [Melopsittacus undulatus]XP_033926534.1 UPF0449 protein C19orf25 homolog [Melopsittacus undulatus]XP_033926535.1 UPF0449 protein C19orf25 homolog [Melopsittacus undulatus]XP_033926536.1 UPF0449 protein C19orf25 homolog [Melopsittacus undulatus]